MLFTIWLILFIIGLCTDNDTCKTISIVLGILLIIEFIGLAIALAIMPQIMEIAFNALTAIIWGDTMTVYEIITNDKYELPIAQFDTAYEVADWLRWNSYHDVYKYIKNQHVINNKYRIIKVEIGENVW